MEDRIETSEAIETYADGREVPETARVERFEPGSRVAFGPRLRRDYADAAEASSIAFRAWLDLYPSDARPTDPAELEARRDAAKLAADRAEVSGRTAFRLARLSGPERLGVVVREFVPALSYLVRLDADDESAAETYEVLADALRPVGA